MSEPDVSTADPETLERPDGHRIAYHKLAGRGPGVVFLGGFMSDMTGTKATFLEQRCRADGRAFVRFDYLGHGQSSGRFEDGTIGRWTEDAIAVIDALTEGPQVVVGSSMGGWVMLRTAAARAGRIAGLVGIAVAPDFTEDLMWHNYDAETRRRLQADGMIETASDYADEPYRITWRLIEDGRNCLVLRSPIAFDGPVRLLHGMEDTDVPWELSLKAAAALTSQDVTVTLIKGGDHRLSEPVDLDRLWAQVAAVCSSAEGGI